MSLHPKRHIKKAEWICAIRLLAALTLDSEGREACKKLFSVYWGCMASIREVLNAASADSERCGKYGDWVRCMEKLIDADHGAK